MNIETSGSEQHWQEYILDRVQCEPNTGCWLWMKSTQRGGYGRAVVNCRSYSAHRLAYEAFKGPLDARLTIDHLCRVHSCCNPDHLEAVTLRENLLRGENLCARNARKTHCLRGHEFTPDNTYLDGRGRTCRACRYLRGRHGIRPEDDIRS